MQYVLQIRTSDGWLAKSFTVTVKSPIPTDILTGRIQVVMTNTISYEGIVAVYAEYTTAAIFSYDQPGSKIDCTGAVTDSWPID